jgi:hypothetical protein
MDAPRRQKGAATPRRQRCPASLSTTARNPTVLKLKSAWAATATGARAALPQNCPRGENRASQQGCKQNLSNNLVTSGKQGNYYLLNRFTARIERSRSSRYRSKRRTQTALLARATQPRRLIPALSWHSRAATISTGHTGRASSRIASSSSGFCESSA